MTTDHRPRAPGRIPPGTAPLSSSLPSPLPADLLDHLADGIVVFDREWRYAYVNARAGALLGRDPAALVGKRYHDEFPEARTQPFSRAYAHAMETGEPAVFEAEYAPWGRWFENRIYPGPHGLTILFTEVTARRDVERALDVSRAQIEAIGAVMPVLIWTWDLGSGEVWRTGSLLRQLGYASADVPGNGPDHVQWWFEHVHPDDREAQAARAAALRVGETADVGAEYRFRRADGSYATLESSVQLLRDSSGQPARAMGIARDVSERAAALQALRASEERYAFAARATSAAIWDWDFDADTLAWSPGMRAIFGHDVGELPSAFDWWIDTVHPDDRDRVTTGLRAVIDGAAGGHEWRDSYRFRRGDGDYADVTDRGYVLRDAAGRAVRMIGAMEDVTAQRQLEARLRQAQKLEAVGQLAGGVAHDFNNLLTVISGNLEFARGALPGEHPARPDLDQIAYAAERARSLVRQLLTFSRRQPVQPRHVRPAVLVRDTERMLRRVLGEEIVFEVRADDRAPAVFADPGQLEQVLVNLAVNARDAMLSRRHGHPGTGGVLTVEVDGIELLPAEAAAWDGLAPGGYVRLRVRDTGHGMDPATRARVFEPFFTTKEVGGGTGLGLATVLGIVQQAGGAVAVDSAPGAGATFTILLPAAGDAASPDGVPSRPAADGGALAAGRGTVLLVEDEAAVRATTRRILERHGYRVLEARHGADGLLVWRAAGGAVDALVSDVRMPELDGPGLAAALRRERPDLPIVLMSGYAADAVPEARALPASAVFLDKPFEPEALLRAVARALAGAPAR
jgi:PAS domain S-box-containing protein